MATKRATVYVLAVGADMGSDLPAAQSTLFSLLIAKVREQKAKDEVAVFLVGSSDTRYRNMLVDQGYQGVYQLWPQDNTNAATESHMANASADLLRAVHNGEWKSAAQSDIVGGIVWGIDAIIQHCRHLKYEKTVCVITNPSTMVDVGLVDGIVNEAVANSIRIEIVGTGFVDPTDDDDTGSNVPESQPHLYSLTQRTGGRFFPDAVTVTAAQSSIALHQPSSRPYAPTFLTLGDRDREDSLIRFPVQYVVKVKSAEMPKITKLSLPALELNDDVDDDWGDLVGGVGATKPTSSTKPLPPLDTVKVELGTGFRAADESGNADPKDTKVYDVGETITAYHYGKSLIPLGDWEKDSVSNDATVGLMVIAFVPASSIRRDMFMSSTRYVVPNLKYEQADIRMAALVSIMRTRGLAAIARYVYNARSSAKLVGLFAHTPKSGNASGLLMTELPTSFDCHRVSYMSLLTDDMANLMLPEGSPSGSGLVNPRLPARFTPTLEQRQAMAVFVGNALLVDSDDEDDEPGENELDVEKHESSNPKYDRNSARKGSELLEPGSVCHPSLQRIHAAIEEALFGAQYPTILPSLVTSSTGSASHAVAAGSASAAPETALVSAPSIPAIPGMQPPPEIWKRPGFDQALALLHSTHKTIKVEKTASKRKTASEASHLDGAAIGSIAKATGNALLMPQSQAMSSDTNGSQAKRPRLDISRSQPLLSKTRWRQDFDKAVGAQDVDNVQQAMSELAEIANKFLEEGHVDEAHECIAVMRNSVGPLNAEMEWRDVVDSHKSRGTALAPKLT